MREFLTIKKCPRCGKSHFVGSNPIDNPVDEYDRFAMCPDTRQPIILKSKKGMADNSAKSQLVVKKGNGVDVTKAVQRDLEARARGGSKKYGTRLKPDNGRDHLVDCYQEILDAACYLKAQIERLRGPP